MSVEISIWIRSSDQAYYVHHIMLKVRLLNGGTKLRLYKIIVHPMDFNGFSTDTCSLLNNVINSLRIYEIRIVDSVKLVINIFSELINTVQTVIWYIHIIKKVVWSFFVDISVLRSPLVQKRDSWDDVCLSYYVQYFTSEMLGPTPIKCGVWAYLKKHFFFFISQNNRGSFLSRKTTNLRLSQNRR